MSVEALTLTDIFSMFEYQETYESLVHPMVEFSIWDLLSPLFKTPWWMQKNKEEP